jgi:hypothetical protein
MIEQKTLELIDVLQSLQAKAADGDSWSYYTIGYTLPTTDSEYDSSVVFSSGTQPSWAEVSAEIPVVQKAHADAAYVYQRASEYPSLVDQLDMIFHGGVDEWKSQIQAIKDKYPKPAQ